MLRENLLCFSLLLLHVPYKERMTHPGTNIQEMHMKGFFMLCFRHSYITNISCPFCIDKRAGTLKQVAELDHSYPEWFPALQGILSNNSLVVPLELNLHWIKHLCIACSKNRNYGLTDVHHGWNYYPSCPVCCIWYILKQHENIVGKNYQDTPQFGD